ncbi:MAG: hypothetical protein RL238_386 [Actinomycetota bacterium]|jgi:hypothetical protein
MLNRQESANDRGSALVMAIVFVTVVGLAVTMGLGYSAVSLRASTRHYEPARDRLYAADAAMKAAVQSVVQSPVNGRSNADGSCKPSQSYGTVDGEPVTVVVCPQGANSLTPKGGASAWGLQTLATGDEDGLVVSGKGGLQIFGNTYANSAIDVSKESLLEVAGGALKALGGCSGPIKVDGVTVTDCTVASAPANDPGYLPGITEPPAAGSGSCDSKTKIATLAAGTWTQSTFDAAIGSCTVVLLQSGVHYLENVTWAIKYRVIAGDLAVATSAIATTAAGAACKQGANGATLILGGTTTITLSGSTATLEVCGKSIPQASGKSVEIPLYGPTADIGGAGSSVSMTATGEDAGGDWDNESDAVKVDGKSANHKLGKKDSSDTLVLTGYGKDTTIPSTVTKLTADVIGYATGTTNFTVVVRTNTGDSKKDKDVCTADTVGTFPSKIGTTTINLTCTTALVPGSKGLTVKFVATTPNSGEDRRAYLDGIVLNYTTTGPKILAQSGCVVTPGGCAVLETKGNSNSISLDGEIYLPKAKIKAQIPNLSTTFSTQGVVVRVLDVQVPASVDVRPIVAAENGVLNDGDVTVQALVNGDVWMTCRVTLTASGQKVTATSVRGCTVPR